jgi:hypothetical protein
MINVARFIKQDKPYLIYQDEMLEFLDYKIMINDFCNL